MTGAMVSAFQDDVLGRHDALALGQMLQAKEVTPLELLEAAARRFELVGSKLGAVTQFDFERASDFVKRMPHLVGVFGAVPSFLKDNTDLVGYPTGYGSDAIPLSSKDSDAPLTKQLHSVGLVFMGKSTTPEFGFNCTTEFARREPTRNPWNTAYSAGGSSGGAAALVASGVVPIAHANDGGGSIRIPAAACGLIGLKPTRGRLIAQDKAKKMPVKIVCDGVLTRSVRDVAAFYHGCEQYWHNPTLPKLGLIEGPGRKRRQIGLIIDSYTSKSCSETRAQVEHIAKTLEQQGHCVIPMELPVAESFVDDFADYWAFIGFTVEQLGRFEFGGGFRRQELDGLTKGLAARFRRRFWRLPGILWRLQRTKQEFAKHFSAYDAVLSPVLGHVTPRLGYFSPNIPFDELFQRMMRYVCFTPINNANGTPAISLPTGLSKDGLPLGIQLSAHHGHERVLLELAFELEQLNCFVMLHNHQT